MSQPDTRRAKASPFDLRTIIGALLLVYGVILLVTSFTTSDAEKAKAHGVNANLWVGIALLVVGALMVLWAFTRPVVIDEEELEADKRAVQEEAERRTRKDGTDDRADESAGERADHRVA
jgi:flagellar biosynthesis/type III secretory pathway M-ring protein FliF/YscJ